MKKELLLAAFALMLVVLLRDEMPSDGELTERTKRASVSAASNGPEPAKIASSDAIAGVPSALSQQDQSEAGMIITEPAYLPPIANTENTPLAYSDDLDDHESYLAFQHAQNKALKQAFTRASTQKVAELERWLERGQAAGLSEEQLDIARRKIQALEKMRSELEEPGNKNAAQ